MNRVVLAAPRRVAQVAVRFVLDLEFSFFGVKNFINIFYRPLSVSVANRDIDTAAKFIGAGAATVGVAGSGAGK